MTYPDVEKMMPTGTLFKCTVLICLDSMFGNNWKHTDNWFA